MTRHVQQLIVCLGCVVALIAGGVLDAAGQPSGPVAAYGFEEGTGSTTSDASGNGQLGMVSGAAWTAQGRYGRALQFDGLNDVVTVLGTPRLDLRTGMTIEAWVMPVRNGFTDPLIVKDAPGGAAYAVEGGANDNRPEARMRLIGQSERRVRNGSIPQNAWSHVAATYDGITLRLYLNGVLTAQRAAAGTLMSSTGALRIGADFGVQQFFAGRIDEVRIYARAISAAEIQADMARPVVPPAPDTAPPTVAILQPTAGMTLSDVVSINVSASDNDAVASVRILVDGEPIGPEQTRAPFSSSWNTTTAGNGLHTVTAVAVDASGNSATSAPVSIAVLNDLTPPAVSLVVSAPGGAASGTIQLAATAIDDVGVAGVDFRVDGVSMGEDTEAPFEASWDTTTASNGDHIVIAVARDASGRFSTSAPASVRVANDASTPSVSITAPGAGGTVSEVISVIASATDDLGVVGVQFLLDGTSLGAEDTSAPYETTWDTSSVADGSHSLSAVARDASGKIAMSPAVSVTVANHAGAPVAVDDAATVAEDSGANTIDVLTNDTDPDGDTRTITAVAPATNGSVVIINGGTGLTYTPKADFFGIDSFSYTVNDGNGQTDTASVSVTVTSVNDPPTAVDDVFTIVEDATSPVQMLFAVTANDSFAPDEGEFLSAGNFTEPVNGTLVMSGETGILADYRPNKNFCGTETLGYTVRDNDGSTDTGNVTINVVCVPDAPVAGNDAATTAEDTPVSGQVLTNDADADAGTTLTAKLASGPAPDQGTVVLNGDGTFTFTPALNFAGASTFTYVANDGQADSNAAVVTITVTPVEDDNPVVSISAPAPGSTVSGSIAVTALASDDTDVVGVQFLVDGVSLGAEDTTNTYEATWDTTAASNGTHVLTAVARDAAGKITTSAPVSVTVANDGAAPTISITAPGAGNSVFGSIGVTASAADDIGVVGVQFLVDGANLGAEDTSAPYEANWDTATASNGEHVLAAIARDASGKSTTASPVTVTVSNDKTAPTVSITAPAAASTVSGSIALAAAATDDVGVIGVQFRLDGANVGPEDTTVPYEASWDTAAAANGDHVLTAVARDASGKATTSSAVTVTVANDATGPTVSLTAPSADSTVSGTVSVTASASDDVRVVGVQFMLDGENLGAEDTTAPYSTSWNTSTATNGSHVLTAVARDASGKRATSAAVSVRVANDGTAPTISITAPAAGNSLSGSVVVSATADDDVGVVGVQFVLDGANLGAEDTTAPYSTTWNTATAANGTHTLTAVARDASGKRTTSSNVNVTVSNETTAPTVSVTAPAPGSTVSGSIAVIASATDDIGVVGVQFLIDGTNIGVEDTTVPYTTTWNTGTASNGTHSITAVARDASGKRTTSSGVTVTVANDNTAPVVSITAPAGGATVSSTIVVAASATDDIAVVGVQFLLDGAALGLEDTTAPYEVSWNTTTSANGAHLLTAIARDASGKRSTSAAVTANVSNVADPNDPSRIGQWAGPFNWPLVTVHMSLLHTGDVLAWDGQDNGGVSATIWNPATNQFSAAPNGFTNLFCASHAQLADGRILVAGGHGPTNLGSRDANVYDPVTRQWTALPRMAFARWYPTATTLPDGRVLVVGGAINCFTCIAEVPEIYDPVTNTWTQVSTARINLPLYPYEIVLPDGRIVNVGANEGITVTRSLDLQTNTWSVVDPVSVDGGSAAMYRPGKILKSGSWSRNTDLPNAPASDTAYVIDMNEPSPRWRQVQSMAFPRAHHVLTLLPDGNVLVTGGQEMTDGITTSEAVLDAEIWSPVTETWTPAGRMKTPRLYHGNALLLPDGRVLVSGGGRLGGARDFLNAEIYSPPYLFKGARPRITATPERIDFASEFEVATPDAASVTSVVLVRPGSVTHTFNTEQRYVELAFRQNGSGLTVTAPGNANLAPPGYYMLFLVNGNGVPSVASFVRLPSPAEDLQAPSAPASLTAVAGTGTATLQWTAATDNTGVALYNVHRSTSPGITPTTANRIAQTTSLGYFDAGLPAGSYFYVVTAQDVVGNVGAASNEVAVAVAADTIPPTVAITSPTEGQVVLNTVTVAANAADNVAVAGVQFMLDGGNLGAEDVVAPFGVAWNTNGVPNGTHVLTAVVRDGAGNTTQSAPVTLMVSNNGTAPAGLMAAYNFDEGTGTVLNDRSGSGNPGTLSGATWTTSGHTGSALTFDGVNDWVTVADSPDLALGGAMTLEAWIYPTVHADWRTAILKETAGGLAYALYSSTDGSRPAAYVNAGGGDVAATGPASLPLNTWSHVAVTYDGALLRLFVNGNQVASTAMSGSIVRSAAPLRLGGNSVWNEFFSGRLDDVRIYNRALGAAEIQVDLATPVP